jgi:serine/threonine protein kinase/class 3 adenylate cyclase
MAAPDLLKSPVSSMDAFEQPVRRSAGFEPLSFVSQGPDGSAVLARASDGSTVELRFVASLRADRLRWSALERRCSLLSLRPIASPSARAIIACDLDGDEPLIALEPAARETLAQWLRAQSDPAIDACQVALMLESLAFAVGAAHRLSIVHGALSPETVSVTEARVLRVEFSGVRCDLSASRWSLACRAPELSNDDSLVEPAADVYALAMIGLGMLVGGDPTEEASRVTAGGVTEGLRAILAQALARDPDDRPSVAEWTLALREWRQSHERGATLGIARDFERATTASKLERGTQLGRYYLVRMLGEGGMGEVWEGMDLTTSASVAIKVMRPEIADRPEFLRRFRKEARTLASVRNPYIANLVEMNEDGDRRYLVMEFVEGRSVAQVLAERGAFDEPTALAIIADACRALIEPHRVGIVHRDLKPDNLMFVRADEPRTGGDEHRQRVKVCDFGIARQSEPVDRHETQATQHGTILGTPAYMAPEQCRGNVDVLPATDVYALGVTLFELLSGRLPFEGATPMEVVLAHLNQPVPELRAIAPGVSEGAASIVARAMAKSISERFCDARAMLDAIERVRAGDREMVAIHPVLPASREGWTRRFVFEFELDARPEELWPYVSDTDKMNRAAGLSPVKYQIKPVVRGVSERVGANSALGIALQWREQPYEWIENKRHSVFREFDRGPVQWYAAEVDLRTSPQGRTLVRHTITLHPRNWIGYLASRIEVGFKYRRALAAVYRRLDAMLARARAGALDAGVDPLAPDPSLARGAEPILRLAAAVASKRVDRAIVDAVCQYVRVASDSDVARMRPYVIADELDLPRELVAEACLALAKEGALTLLWDVLCPSCRISTSVADSLERVRSHGECAACNIDFELDFSSSIELVFRPSPTIRAVETRTFCAGGPGHFPHVVAQLRLGPGERFELALSLPAGRYRVRSAQLSTAIELVVRKGAALRRAELSLGSLAPSAPVALAEDAQTLCLDNAIERELLVRVERMTLAQQALTAAKASSMRAFREMFPEQTLAPGALVSIASMTLVSTAIEDSAALFRAMGDDRAYGAVLEHLRVIENVVSRFGGAVLKTVGARTVSAFDEPASAVEATIELRRALAGAPSCAAIALKIGVHRGTMMAATIGDRLDYFGRNAELAFSLTEEITRPSTLLTQSVADEPSVRALLIERSLRRTPRRVRSLGLDSWGVELE